ncbi:conserved membrane hypothetical protein [Vibrio chagasii]|nr:conserved membrane hypothetical protein [Vibrio chagasii]
MLNKSKLFESVFLLSFGLSLIFPIFPTYTFGMMYHVLIITFLPLVFISTSTSFNKLILTFVSIFFAFFFFVSLVSLLANEGLSISGLLSSSKLVYFYIYILFGFVYSYSESGNVTRFIRLYYAVLVFSLIVAFSEKVTPSINFFLYKREYQEIISDKLTSIFNTTYHYAFFLTFGFIFLCVNAFESIAKSESISKLFLNFIKILLLFYIIFLTNSRMFFMTVILFLSIYGLLFFLTRRFSIKSAQIVLISLFAIVSLFIVNFDFIENRYPYVITGVQYILSGGLDFSGGGSGSFNSRINQIIHSVVSISEQPLLGAGSGKDIYLESIYAYTIFKYGISSVFVYFLSTLSLCLVCYNGARISRSHDERVFFKSCLWFLLFSPFYFLSGPLFEVPKLSLFFFSLIGVILGAYSKLKLKLKLKLER